MSRGVEPSVEVGVEKMLIDMQVSRRYRETKIPDQEQKLDRSIRCREVIKEAGTCSIDPPSIEVLARLR